MFRLKQIIQENLKLIILVVILIVILIGGGFYYWFNIANEKNNIIATELVDSESLDELEKEEQIQNTKIKVDIKGQVNNPGVYEVEENSIVNDAINMAGGLTSDATTENINLSYKLVDEMVIIIYHKDELKAENKEITTVYETQSPDITQALQEQKSIVIPSKSTKDDHNKKEDEQDDLLNASQETNEVQIININLATKEELMNLDGIGEAKADNIISYRETNGLFTDIEELKNVSGIGETIFDQIKEFITIQ